MDAFYVSDGHRYVRSETPECRKLNPSTLTGLFGLGLEVKVGPAGLEEGIDSLAMW